MRTKERIVAVDPGKNGAIVVFTDGAVDIHAMPQTTRDMIEFFRKPYTGDHVTTDCTVYMEKVGGYVKGNPAPGSAMFNFGLHVGDLRTSIMAAGIRLELVPPQKWIKALGLGTRGKMTTTQWKNKLKAMAQRLYPGENVTLKNADALLILEYARRDRR